MIDYQGDTAAQLRGWLHRHGMDELANGPTAELVTTAATNSEDG